MDARGQWGRVEHQNRLQANDEAKMDRFSDLRYDQKSASLSIACGDTALVNLLSELCSVSGVTPYRVDSIAALLAAHESDESHKETAICIDLRAEMDGTNSEISELVYYCKSNGTRLVVVTDLERIDALFGLVPEELTQLVIGDDPAALLSAITVATRTRTMGTLFDHKKDQTTPALSKISAELAEFARALSKLAQAEEDDAIGADYLADKPRSYLPPSGRAPLPFTSITASAAEAEIDPTSIRNLIRVRRLRTRFFAEELFADPAWDILLDLMASRLEGTKVSVSSLCIAAAVPATTALRWIKSMTDEGYLERRADPTDARRVYIHLSDETAQKMAQYLRARGEVSGF